MIKILKRKWVKAMNGEILISADKVKRKKKIIKIARILLLILMLILLISYIVVGVVYSSGSFTISLDQNLYFERGIIIYDDPDYKVYRSELYARTVDSFDNITYRWLPNDLHEHRGGSHNGDNYVAYTFFVENTGDKVADYWVEVVIDDAINNVDEAVRIRIYRNSEYVTYAKLGRNGRPEIDTTPFLSDTLIALDHVENFKPGDIDKYTVVIWLEGKDPECNDNILGGEIKIHMAFNSEYVEK